jgi:thiol:disulfide interchange protein DsbD
MRLAIVSAALVFACAVVPASARPLAADHVRVELIAEDNAFVPGRRAWLGLHFVHEPHWHTYWINPGDSGLPTKLQWHLPEGFQAGAVAWPAPQRFESGGIVNFGYDGRALLLVPVDVPASARAGTSAHVAVDAKWLVCREECIPGKATPKLALPIAKSAHAFPRWQRAFAAARARVPAAAAWTGKAESAGERIRVTLAGPDLPTAGADAFVVQPQVVGSERPQLRRDGPRLVVDFPRSEYFSAPPSALDLVVSDGGRARRVSVPFAAGANPAAH